MQPLLSTASVARAHGRRCRLLLALAAISLLSACAGEKALPKCEGDVRVLNAGKWPATENDLKSACLPGGAIVASLDLGVRS